MLRAAGRCLARASRLASSSPHFPDSRCFSSSEFKTLPFDVPALALREKSTTQLLQSWAILSACRFRPLVDNAERLLASPLLLPVGMALARPTFARHFTAGEDLPAVAATAAYLARHRLHSIIQYGAERAVGEAGCTCTEEELARAEALWDENMATFVGNVQRCGSSGTCISAFKVTALGPPALLEKLSGLLAQRQHPHDRGAFSAGALRGGLEDEFGERLTALERGQLQRLVARLARLGAAAEQQGNVRLLVDAEWVRLQPAIDVLAIALQQEHNRKKACVMNTYQNYLKDSQARVGVDLARSEAEGYVSGAKMVRGAYRVAELARAQQLGQPSPVHDSMAATHANYDRNVATILERAAQQPEVEVLIGTHNLASVQRACATMHRLGLQPDTPGVYFAQLLGMADHLSFTLARHGYAAYKVVTWGPLQETLAFLVRRAQENSDVLGGVSLEVAMIRAEVLRRLSLGWLPGATTPLSTAAPASASA